MPITTETIQPFYDALTEDDDLASQFPNIRPIVAHYTSVSVFEKIVSNDEIWFSHPLNMTDIQELRYGMEEGYDQFRSNQALAIACGSDETYKKLLKFHDMYFRFYGEQHVMDTYILCTALHERGNDDGSLSMWRGYGANGGGIALVFDTAALNENRLSPFVVGEVDYLAPSARVALLKSKLAALADCIAATDKSDVILESAAYAWIERLKIFALFTKHQGFIEEKEWRFVYMPERDIEGSFKSMLGYHVTGHGVENKLKLKFSELAIIFNSDISLEKLIVRIILGPNVSSKLSKIALRRMLEVMNRQTLAGRVTESSIPYRPHGSST